MKVFAVRIRLGQGSGLFPEDQYKETVERAVTSRKKKKKKSEEMDSCMEKRIQFREEVLTKGAGPTLPGDIKGAVFEGWVTFSRCWTRMHWLE